MPYPSGAFKPLSSSQFSGKIGSGIGGISTSLNSKPPAPKPSGPSLVSKIGQGFRNFVKTAEEPNF
jgi:hypothetical protein